MPYQPIHNDRTDSSTFLVGRVIEITLEPSSSNTFSLEMGDIKFESLTNTTNLNKYTAKPFFPQIKYYPLINETVYLINGSTFKTTESPDSEEWYYLNVINTTNNTLFNAQPILNKKNEITNSEQKNNDFGKTFEEKSTIKSLLPFEGDYILEGRWGNSIRFGSTVPSSSIPNQWSRNGKNGDPITIIRNGQSENEPVRYINLENINDDPSSIYMTNNQQIPINVAQKKLDTFDIVIEKSPNVGYDEEDELEINEYNNLGAFPLSDPF